MPNSARHSNKGTIIGKGGSIGSGGDGHAAVTLPASYTGNFLNYGLLRGGAGGRGAAAKPGGTGGAGVALGGGTLTNAGTVTGGAGGAGGPAKQAGVTGGAGGTLIQSGTVTGGSGASAAAGGVGIEITGGTITQSGIVTGGAGSYYQYAPLGTGGSGLDMRGGAVTESATGAITGGSGAHGGYSVYVYSNGFLTIIYPQPFNGSAGGAGVTLSGGTLTQLGKITGGAGGNGDTGQRGGAGGAGVYLNGGTLIEGGTVTGGAGGTKGTYGSGDAAGAPGAAIAFGATASTLVLEPGATINGFVQANLAAQDTLVLDGTASGTLDNLGVKITNFATISEAASASWTLAGSNNITAGETFTAAGALSVQGTLTIGGSLVDSGHATVNATLAGAGSILIAGGTVLTLKGTDNFAGTVQIGNAATLISTTGAIASQILDFQAASGTLELGAPGAYLGTIHGFGGQDVIDLLNTASTGFTFAFDVLTIENARDVVANLNFATGLTAADFAIGSDRHGGTLIHFV